jgi:nucleoside-diphosphate-sugar epimerase
MQTILGAGGAIGTELLRELAHTRHPVRLVGRDPKLVPGTTEALSADISDLDQTIRAVSGSTVVYLLVGLKYELRVWRELWPRIMHNAIEACKRANAKLIFFDNVYMYGKVSGPMTEETPFNPCSKNGEIRAQIATTLLNEIRAGKLNAMIARSADFYGYSAPTMLVLPAWTRVIGEKARRAASGRGGRAVKGCPGNCQHHGDEDNSSDSNRGPSNLPICTDAS